MNKYNKNIIKRHKIICFFIIFNLIMIFTISCDRDKIINEDKNISKSKQKIEKIQLTEKEKILGFSENNYDVLYFESNMIIVGKEILNVENADCSDIDIYVYNANDKKLKLITRIENFNLTMGSMKQIGDDLYYPYISLENNKEINHILRINKKTLLSENIKYEKNGQFTIDIESDGKNVLRHYLVNGNNGETDYYLDVVRGKKDKSIIHSSFINGEGEMIVSIYVGKNKIYSYEETVDYGKVRCYINQYSMTGKLERKQEINVGSFLELDEIDEKDSIFNIYKIKNYFILKTVNGRNLILRDENNKLEPISVPQELQNLDVRANVLEGYGKDEKLLYFQCVGEPQKIIVFNSNDESFSFGTITSNENILNMYTDVDGNLLIKTNEKDDKIELFYLEKNTIMNFKKIIFRSRNNSSF